MFERLAEADKNKVVYLTILLNFQFTVPKNLNTKKYWLRSVCLSVVIILVVGGITRLTGSGLSMVDWRPVAGILPPITDHQWNNVFMMYQESPEYQKVNKGMSLDDFKFIFFWEYLHRILGRIVGLLCLVPYLWFLFRGKLSGNLKLKGLCLNILVISQGLMGWYMVKSGLVNVPEVSHYRLAAHLSLAFSVFGLAWWMLLDLDKKLDSKNNKNAVFFRPWAIGFLLLLCAQIAYGAFVSGMDAGKIYNSWPLMGDTYFPNDNNFRNLFKLSVFSDPSLVQFIHRNIAYLIGLFYLLIFYKVYSNRLFELYKSINILGLTIILQIILGIFTVIYSAQIYIASLHQISSIVLVSSCIYFLHINTKFN